MQFFGSNKIVYNGNFSSPAYNFYFGVFRCGGKMVSKDGLELVVQTNYLGHFLLTNLLKVTTYLTARDEEGVTREIREYRKRDGNMSDMLIFGI
jgi:hypothetical protein